VRILQGEETKRSNESFGLSSQRQESCHDNYHPKSERCYLAKGTSRRDTTSKGASSHPCQGLYPSPPLYLPISTIILCLVVGSHERTALVGSLECREEKKKKKEPYPCLNGPCMHCHVDDGSGNLGRLFPAWHAHMLGIQHPVTTVPC
jgi:hypothetical protein